MATEHFTDAELNCPHCGKMEFPEAFLQHLETIRVIFGRPMPLNSGYRCPDYNDQISDTGRDGPHTKGAVDVRISGQDAYELVGWALRMGWTGIGINQKGDFPQRFVHLDRLHLVMRPRIWTY